MATHERGLLTAGSKLPVWQIKFSQFSVTVGLQICREVKYPEQWRVLSLKGAQLLIHLNNAIFSDHIIVNSADTSVKSVWQSQLVARASENQRWVVSVNPSGAVQKSPTVIISPSGNIKSELTSEPQIHKALIELEEVSNWYLDQRALDVLKIVESDQQHVKIDPKG